MNNFDRAESEWLEPRETPVIGSCENCGGEIYQGEEFYEYDGEMFCEKNCILEYMEQNGDFTIEGGTY